MGKQIAELYAVISGDTSKLEAALKSSKAGLTGLSDQTKKTQSTMGNFTKGLDSTVQGLTGFSVAQLTVAGAVGAFVVGAKKAIDAASNMEETTSKVGVVFGKSAEEVRKFGTDAATSLGMSKQAALDAAGTFGNLFVSMGMGKQASADMSTRLVQLAGDLASFNNIDPGEALEKLRAGIVGEAEPLRALGVNLTEAAVQARAMEMGLADSTKELTTADKVTARYALILEQTTTAQGDFSRTSEGAANQMRILNAELENIKAIAGKSLLPGYAAELREITGSLKIYSQNLEDLQSHSKNIFQILRENQTAYAALDAQLKMATGQQWDWNDAQREGLRVGKMIPGAVEEAKKSVEDTFVAIEAGGNFWETFGKKQANAARQAAVETRNYNAALKEQESLLSAYGDAAEQAWQAQLDLNKNFGQQAAADLSKYAGEGKKYREGLKIQDEVLGTNSLAMFDADKKLDQLNRDFASGKIDADTYKSGLADQRGAWANLSTDIRDTSLAFDEALTKWNNFITSLGEANGKRFTMNVDIITNYGKPDTTPNATNDQWGGRAAPSLQTGADFYVPAGYPNDTYPFKAYLTSGEHVTVTPAGQATTGETAVTVKEKPQPYILNFYSTKANSREVAKEVVTLLSRH